MAVLAQDGPSQWLYLGLALIVFGMLLLLRRRQKHTEFDKLPGPWKHAHPLLGNLLEVLRPDIHRLLLEWANEYGGIFRASLLWMEGIVVTDPAAVAAICGRGGEGMDKADIIYTPINQMCTPHGKAPNLLTSPADSKWKAVRKAIAVSFSANNIRKKYPVIQSCVNRLVTQLEDMARDSKEVVAHVDINQAVLRVTLDVIGMTAFDHNFGFTELGPPSEPAPSYHLLRVLPRCFTEIMLRVANPIRGVVPSYFKGGLKGQQSFFNFHTEMRMLLRKCLARPNPPDPQDFSIGAQLWRLYYASQEAYGSSKEGAKEDSDLTAGGLLPPPPNKLGILALRFNDLMRTFCIGSSKGAPANSEVRRNGKANDAHITAERIMSEIGILFVEGFETTGHTISWTLLKVATVPGVQDKIVAELNEMGLLVKPGQQPPARPVGLDDLHSLKYMTACIKEAMRMLPVVSIMGRAVGPNPARVGPYLIPAGTPVAIPLFAIQNTVHNWEAPDIFIPERWLQVPLETYVVGDMPPLNSTMNEANGPKQHRHHDQNGTEGLLRVSATNQNSCNATEAPVGEVSHQGKRIVFAPFSEGHRNCVGQVLAKLEVSTVVATLLAHFRVELAPEMGGPEGVKQRESTHLTLQLKGTQGLRMLLHPRSQPCPK